MDFNLAGRTAVVTGGSKGIGLTVVRLLAASGARLPPTYGWAATASPRPSARPPEPRLTAFCGSSRLRACAWKGTST
jgi:hypothetical protein